MPGCPRFVSLIQNVVGGTEYAYLKSSRAIEIVCPLPAGLILVPAAQGQAGDWRAVENLAPGSRISVKIRFHMLCDFRRATEADARSRTNPARPILGSTRNHLRPKTHPRSPFGACDDANTAVGTTVGAAVGAGVGNSSLGQRRGSSIWGCGSHHRRVRRPGLSNSPCKVIYKR